MAVLNGPQNQPNVINAFEMLSIHYFSPGDNDEILYMQILSTQFLEGIRRKGVSLINEDADKICLDWCLVKLRKIALNVGSFNKFDSVT